MSLETENAELRERVKELEGELESLASYAATALSVNTVEWSEGLVERLNHACEVLNDPQRFRLRHSRDQMIVLCKPEDHSDA